MRLTNGWNVNTMNDGTLLTAIRSAFLHRRKPESAIRADAPNTDEYQDATAFNGRDWELISCGDLENYPAAVSGFSAEAFCYYLPGILSAGLREGRADLLVNSALIYMLDRGNGPSSWDDFFVERWGSLTKAECDAVQRWLLWLSESEPPEFNDDELARAFDTLNVISNREHAIPIASRGPRRA